MSKHIMPKYCSARFCTNEPSSLVNGRNYCALHKIDIQTCCCCLKISDSIDNKKSETLNISNSIDNKKSETLNISDSIDNKKSETLNISGNIYYCPSRHTQHSICQNCLTRRLEQNKYKKDSIRGYYKCIFYYAKNPLVFCL